MATSNLTITHGSTGVVLADVSAARQVSPHFVRVTLAGEQLRHLRQLGFDQWFRLAVPTDEHTRFDKLPDTYNLANYLKFMATEKATRPTIRNYTVRAHRPELGELDVDFVVHGSEGVAGPWAASLPVGAQVGLIDQGCGFTDPDATQVLLVGDESALPAVLGILRDLPRSAQGTALIEVPDALDEQPVVAPEGVRVQWLVRDQRARPGQLALARVKAITALDPGTVCFAAGEAGLATGARRHLVSQLGVPKAQVTFCGYWKQGVAH